MAYSAIFPITIQIIEKRLSLKVLILNRNIWWRENITAFYFLKKEQATVHFALLERTLSTPLNSLRENRLYHKYFRWPTLYNPDERLHKPHLYEPVSHHVFLQVIKFHSRQATMTETQRAGDNRLLSSTCHNASPVKYVSTVANGDRWAKDLALGGRRVSFYASRTEVFPCEVYLPSVVLHNGTEFCGGIPGSAISLKG